MTSRPRDRLRPGGGRTARSTPLPGLPADDVMFAGLVASAAAFTALLAGAAVVAAVVSSGATDLPPVPGLVDPGPVVRYGIPTARTLLDVFAAAAAGVALLARFLVVDRAAAADRVLHSARVVGLWASVGWTCSAVLSVVLLTAEIDPGGVPGLPAIWAYVTNVPAGKGLVLSAACGVVSALLARWSLRHGEAVPAELRAGVVLFGVLPLSLTGHASNWYYHDLSMVVMEVHVVAATAWAGSLGAVVVLLSRRPVLLAAAMPRYSRLATWCVVVVGATGVFTGLLELALSPVTALPGSLLSTRFGVLVLAKAVVTMLVAGIALVARNRLVPAIARGHRTAIAVWCGWELLVLAMAFGVAAVLTRASVSIW